MPLLFISKFYRPIPIMLWLIIAISYVLGHTVDFYVVLALLIFNTRTRDVLHGVSGPATC
jgi:hypothetical protein